VAATLRMNYSEPFQRAGSLIVTCSGAFGRRVADFLLGCAMDGQTRDTVTSRDIELAFEQGSGAVVAALWRPDPPLCEQADKLAFQHGRTWLPIVMDHPVIRIGPLVRPPAGPCFTCSYRRRVQHDAQHAVTAVVHAAYQADPTCGPGGYLPHHARLAAAIARMFLGAGSSGVTDANSLAPGSVITIRLTRNSMQASRVVPCSDCAHCAAAMPARENTGRASRVPGLAAAFNHAGGGETAK
jgi:bacteriocin biosynthesis cyclodehydratase domain-containing protein